MGESAGDALLEGIRRAYTSKKYADVKVKCGEGNTWEAHKLVLSAHSEYFRAVCDGKWKEGEEGIIQFPDDDPQTVDAMLAFLYKGSYGDDGNSQTDCEPMTLDARVFIIADKNFIKPLKAAAAERFATRARDEWNTPGFADAIIEVYDKGPANDRTLREIILDVVCENSDKLYGKELEYADFHRVVDEVGDFAADVTRALAPGSSRAKIKKAADEKTYKCPNGQCGMTFTVRTYELDGNDMTCPRQHNAYSLSWWNKHLVKG